METWEGAGLIFIGLVLIIAWNLDKIITMVMYPMPHGSCEFSEVLFSKTQEMLFVDTNGRMEGTRQIPLLYSSLEKYR